MPETAATLGTFENRLKILSKDGQRFHPGALLDVTGLKGGQLGNVLSVSRPMLYREDLPMKGRLRKTILALVRATDLAYELLGRNLEETKKWLRSPNTVYFGDTPFEVIMRGDGEEVISWISERLGIKSGAAF